VNKLPKEMGGFPVVVVRAGPFRLETAVGRVAPRTK